MKADVPYFTHNYDAHRNRKLKSLYRLHGYAGLGIYWTLIEFLRGADDYCVDLNDEEVFEDMAEELHFQNDKEKFLSFLEDFTRLRLLTNEDGIISSPGLDARMEWANSFRRAKSEAGKKGAEERWQRHRAANGTANGSANSNVVANDSTHPQTNPPTNPEKNSARSPAAPSAIGKKYSLDDFKCEMKADPDTGVEYPLPKDWPSLPEEIKWQLFETGKLNPKILVRRKDGVQFFMREPYHKGTVFRGKQGVVVDRSEYDLRE